MRHCSTSKRCIFVFCNESLFTSDYRTFYYKRKYSRPHASCSTYTNQVVEGVKLFHGNCDALIGWHVGMTELFLHVFCLWEDKYVIYVRMRCSKKPLGSLKDNLKLFWITE
jgi:hypothetical protein